MRPIEWLYAAGTFVLLTAGIFALVRVETAILGARRRRALARDVAAVRRDPRLSRWADLAERRGVVERHAIEAWEARYQALLADPRRRGFATLALEGEFLEDHQIDYRLDPAARRTCEHLRAVESALRAAGITCSAATGPHGPAPFVTAAATLDGPALLGLGDVSDSVEWQTESPSAAGRARARLVCVRCLSWIESGGGPPFPA